MIDVMDIEDLVPEEFAGICGIATPIIIYLFIGIAILVHPSFSWSDNAISDLGRVEYQYSNILNFGFIVGGIAAVIFTMGIWRFVETKVGVLGTTLFLIGMISLILLGVFPKGTEPHMYVTILFYALSIGGMVLIGADQLWDFVEPIWGIFILATVILAGAAVWLVYSIPYNMGPAIPEFIGSIPVMLFTIVMGARLYFE